jgi:hypothetical protein
MLPRVMTSRVFRRQICTAYARKAGIPMARKGHMQKRDRQFLRVHL